MPQGMMMNSTGKNRLARGVLELVRWTAWMSSFASRDEDEQYKGKNSLLRRGVLVLGELVGVRMEWI